MTRAEVRRTEPEGNDPEVMLIAVPESLFWLGNRGVLSLVGIAPTESHTACVNAFSFSSEKKKKKKNEGTKK